MRLTVTLLLLVSTLLCADANYDVCKKLTKLDYNLFGTRTNYNEAKTSLYRRLSLPNSFGIDELKDEHKWMVNRQSCKPVAIYYLGRHSAGFPCAQQIVDYNKSAFNVIKKLKNNRKIEKCPQKFRPYLKWTPIMSRRHDKLTSATGAYQTKQLARRFKSIYPELFDAQTAEVTVATTNKFRTAQTAAQFLTEVSNVQVPQCDLTALPTDNHEDEHYDIDAIRNNECYNSILTNNSSDVINFHEICEISSKFRKTIKDPVAQKIKKGEGLKQVVENVSKRLALYEKNNPNLDFETVRDLWNLCRYEKSVQDSSIWCDLFSKDDIRSFDYASDYVSYHKNVYGETAMPEQACPVISEILDFFQKSMDESGSTLRSKFNFFHAASMRKMFAALGLFKDEVSFTAGDANKFITKQKIPRNREFRQSLEIPYSANMAFILYKCTKVVTTYKILTTVTELPVLVDGCKGIKCSAQDFFDKYDWTRKECNLKSICDRSASPSN